MSQRRLLGPKPTSGTAAFGHTLRVGFCGAKFTEIARVIALVTFRSAVFCLGSAGHDLLSDAQIVVPVVARKGFPAPISIS